MYVVLFALLLLFASKRPQGVQDIAKEQAAAEQALEATRRAAQQTMQTKTCMDALSADQTTFLQNYAYAKMQTVPHVKDHKHSI